ncbi:MAG: poly-gamma-glutamate synthase PgsB [Rhodococcus sp.]|nr:poly-gamma-glutamate synthase PgsB [Rhodococcus sp. (in: high G+C Gram-positive bacteria)]
MTRAVLGLLVLVVIGAALLFYWRLSIRGHQQRLRQLDVRVHVNGIRGKSTVTRLVGGVLREGGYVTVAKTTGSAARVIGPHGEETPIFRRGAANINEQIDIVAEHIQPDVEALVIECMAVRPLYQQYSQDYMVRSDITVITNVREDHQEEMGETLEEIADSMAVTIPRGGVVITAEDRPHLRERLRMRAHERGSTLIYADPESVDDEDMRGFDYLQFKENVAIGLAIARICGVSHRAALEGFLCVCQSQNCSNTPGEVLRGRRELACSGALRWARLFDAVWAGEGSTGPHFLKRAGIGEVRALTLC